MDEKNDWRVAENRDNWDDRAKVHAASPFYEVERLVADRAHVSPVARRDLEVLLPHLGARGLAGRSVLHLQCHIGTDTLCALPRGDAGRLDHARGKPAHPAHICRGGAPAGVASSSPTRRRSSAMKMSLLRTLTTASPSCGASMKTPSREVAQR